MKALKEINLNCQNNCITSGYPNYLLAYIDKTHLAKVRFLPFSIPALLVDSLTADGFRNGLHSFLFSDCVFGACRMIVYFPFFDPPTQQSALRPKQHFSEKKWKIVSWRREKENNFFVCCC